jgi:hypothetical protein
MSWVLWCLVIAVASLIAARHLRRSGGGVSPIIPKPIEQWSKTELLSWLRLQHKNVDPDFEDTCYIEVTADMQRWPADSNRRFICREILEAISQYEYLRDGGLDEQTARARVLGFYGVVAPVDCEDSTRIVGAILENLRPGYQAQYGDVLKGVLPSIQGWVLSRINEAKTGPSHPPAQWIRFQVTIEDVDRDPVPMVRDSVDPEPYRWDQVRLRGWSKWEQLKGRMVDGDELWAYSSVDGPREILCGRAGLVVLRQSRPVGQLVLTLN